ncbi:CAAX amino terminal protease family protein [Rhynchospora pubera]|uniref:CAAX amino terminal protease family protein n=1 Tax=Rhynchospora pubera TaxID=906938 RepID=A0AAV8GWW9_9POAL|nr:CAAX amino terminal protease family protein [Rhynchospora pubera]
MSGPCSCRAPLPLLTPPPRASSKLRARVSISPTAQPIWHCSGSVPLDRERSFVKRWRLRPVSCYKNSEEESPSNGTDYNFIDSQNSNSSESTPEEPDTKRKHWFSRLYEVVGMSSSVDNNGWAVPWTAKTIIQVMLLWVASFWLVGSWIIPFLAHWAGFNKQSLTYRGQAIYSLITDLAEGLAGISILHYCLSKFKPLPPGWFRFNFKLNFSLRDNWLLDIAVGCLFFPLVNLLSHVNLLLVPALPAPPVGLSGVEQSIVAQDPVAVGLYALVVTVCAPVWEEILFRGFLLPSLTRYMPVHWAIFMSAVAFAFAHFNVHRILPLILLGILMGAVFTKSKNLLASMVFHSLWNWFVFWDLLK